MTHIMGKFPGTIGRDRAYFDARNTWLDCRGTLIIHAKSHWGFNIIVITLSHAIERGVRAGFFDGLVDRPVIVKEDAWIGSSALLYNCVVHEGAVVAVGAVVRSCEVMPGVMVAGNPAVAIARWNSNGWVRSQEKWRVLA